MIDAEKTAVVGSACSCVLGEGSDREDRSLDVCCLGDTRWSFSVEYDDSILHTHHLFCIVSHRNTTMYQTTCMFDQLSGSHARCSQLVDGLKFLRGTDHFK